MPTILLRLSWQTVNIGDIGHTPGMLALLERYHPDAQIILWGCRLDRGVREMLQERFPRVRLLEGYCGEDGMPQTDQELQAWQEADFFLHGSGPYLVARREVAAWKKNKNGRPYGVYGITLGKMDDELRELLNGAAFVFCRDTKSLAFARANGVASPILDFAPDAAFASTDRDDARADAWLTSRGLDAGGYLCVIPRLRYTPYFKIHSVPPTEEDKRREAVSEEFRERDHAKLRDVITRWVETTGRPVIACPEMTYQVELAKQELIDPLPPEIRDHVVWRDTYWRPDEAASVYARAAALVSIEMHSPILALGVSTPAVLVRQPTDTFKGQMWRDIGLADWMFEIDDVDGAQIARTTLGILSAPDESHAKLSKAQQRILQTQEATMQIVATVFS